MWKRRQRQNQRKQPKSKYKCLDYPVDNSNPFINIWNHHANQKLSMNSNANPIASTSSVILTPPEPEIVQETKDPKGEL